MSLAQIPTTEPGLFARLAQDFATIWGQGGWAMYAIAGVAMLMFGMGWHVRGRLRQKGFLGLNEDQWRHWLEHPEARQGAVGKLLDFICESDTIEEVSLRCRQVASSEAASFDRDLRVMKVCVGAAPLFGLLGTVTGMLVTFAALASGSGGDQTMAMIASGISEALVTTETGLVVALPGVFFQHMLNRDYQKYKAFLAQLESVCTQTVYRQKKAEDTAKLMARLSASEEVVARLRAAVS